MTQATDFTPVNVDLYEDDVDTCELCGEQCEDGLAIVEGVLCCEPCAMEHGWDPFGFADAMSEELRRL